MGIDPVDLHWYYSGGVNNTNGQNSFGGARAANQGDDNKTWDVLGTLTLGTGNSRRVIGDSARIGDGVDAHVGKGMMLVDGAAAHAAARIIAFDTATGRFALEAPLSNNAVPGDTYHIYELNGIFDDVNALDCAIGRTDYRLVYWRNESGITANKTFYYQRILGPFEESAAPVIVELFARRLNNSTEAVRSDDEQGPPASQILSNDGFVEAVQRFGLFATPSIPHQQAGTVPFTANNVHRAVWVKRTVLPNTRRNDSVAIQITAEVTSNDDQSVVANSMLFAFSLAGFTPAITLRPDRGPIRTQRMIDDGYQAAMRQGHGARMIAEIQSQETGFVVPGLEIGWELEGPGTLSFPTAPTTDANGIAKATYSAPPAIATPRATIGFDASSFAVGVDDGDTIFVNHTIGTGTERLLLAFSMATTLDDPPADPEPYRLFTTSVTYDGIALERIAEITTTAGARMEAWILRNPPSGILELRAIHPRVADALGLAALSFSGVDQTTTLDVEPSVKLIENDASVTWSDTVTTVTQGSELAMGFFPVHPFDFSVTTVPPAVLRTIAGIGQTIIALPQFSTQAAPIAGEQTQAFTDIDVSSDRVSILVALRSVLEPATVIVRA